MAIASQLCRIPTPSDPSLARIPSLPRRKPISVRCSGDGNADFDPKLFRKNLTRSENYNRRGFGRKEETLELMNREYTSKSLFLSVSGNLAAKSCWFRSILVFFSGDVIKTLKENGNEYTWGNVTVKLAEAYGFCWGVERAVQIAYEARKQFPDEKIWITNEIIHNPTVNKVFPLFTAISFSSIQTFFSVLCYSFDLEMNLWSITLSTKVFLFPMPQIYQVLK